MSVAHKHAKLFEYEESLEGFTLVANHEMLPKRSVLRAEATADRANSLFRLKRYSEALADCAQAIYIQSDNQRAWLTKAYVLHAQEKHEEALKELESLMLTWGSGDPVVKKVYETAQFEVRKAKRPDYYSILSPELTEDVVRPLSPLSSELEIKKMYKKKVMQCHPDRFANLSPEERKKKEEEFKLIGEAFEILTDSFTRQLYDQGFDKEAILERVRRASERRSV